MNPFHQDLCNQSKHVGVKESRIKCKILSFNLEIKTDPFVQQQLGVKEGTEKCKLLNFNLEINICTAKLQ